MSATEVLTWPTLKQFEAARKQLDEAVDAVQQVREAVSDCEAAATLEQVGALSGFVSLARAYSIALAAIVAKLAAERDAAAASTITMRSGAS